MRAGEPPRHGGERIAQALAAEGVSIIFTLCGGHISPILAAAKALGMRIVDVRDEVTAVFAADAYTRLTGQTGVAAVTAGPGLTNCVTALKNAQLAQVPLLLLGGAAPTALQGRGALQDIDQRPLIEPHVKAYRRARRVAELGPAVHELLAQAQAGVPGPAVLECAVDLLYEPALIRQWYADAAGKGQGLADKALRWYLTRHADRLLAGTEVETPPPSQPTRIKAPRPAERSVKAAQKALAKAERPLAVIGSQALAGCVGPASAAALAGAIERLGVPVYLSGMGRGLLGRQHPLLLRHQRRNALREADCVLLAGVPCDFRLDYGKHIRRSATLIAANRSRRDARLNRRPTVAAIGDAGLLIHALATGLRQTHSDPSPRWSAWVDKLKAADAARETEIQHQAQDQAQAPQDPNRPVNPLALLKAIDAVAAEDAVFVADGGDFVSTAAYVLQARGPLAWLDPGAFGTLGVGAGFGIGALSARPQAECWVIFGDGALGWSLAEFDTLVRHGLPAIAVVGNDAGWTQIAREQVKMLGDDVGTVLARTDYHRAAEGLGAAGLLVRRPDEVLPALQQAREIARQGRPVLINVWLDRTDFREGSLSM